MFFPNAACSDKDPEIFFVEDKYPMAQREARLICQGCEHQEDCLEYAIWNDEKFGIWGGMNTTERRRLRRQRRRLGRKVS